MVRRFGLRLGLGLVPRRLLCTEGGPWSCKLAGKIIAIRELHAARRVIIAALKQKPRSILLHTDNTNVLAWLSKGSARNAEERLLWCRMFFGAVRSITVIFAWNLFLLNKISQMAPQGLFVRRKTWVCPKKVEQKEKEILPSFSLCRFGDVGHFSGGKAQLSSVCVCSLFGPTPLKPQTLSRKRRKTPRCSL